MDTAGDALKPETVLGNAPVQSPPPPKRGPFFERADWLSFGLTAVLIFVVYLFTLSPSIDLEYSGNFTTGAMYAGVPDTPGFPLWTIYAHVFIVIIPFSNIAWRVSVSSAFASAVACGLIALMVSRCGAEILNNLRGFQRLDAKSEKWLRLVAGYVAGMSFGLSGGVWGNSVIVVWWPLTFAMFAAVICLLLQWNYTPEKTRYLFVAFFLYGLALTNSQSLIVALFGLELFILLVDPPLGRDLFALAALLFVPVLILNYGNLYTGLWTIYFVCAFVCLLLAAALMIATRRIFTRWKAALGCMTLMALGLCLYFYCPIASMTNPPMNWGYPRTVEGFFHLVSRGQYEGIHPTAELDRYWMQIPVYGHYLRHDYGWPYLIPAAVPFLMLHRLRSYERRWMLGLLVALLCESFFLLVLLNPNNDKSTRELFKAYFAPSFLILAVWTGCGLVLLGSIRARPHERTTASFKPSGEHPPNVEAYEKAREAAWKQAKEISKKI